MSSTLRDALFRTKQISNTIIPSTSVVSKMEGKLEDNIDLRTEIINLKSQIKTLKETEALQSAEFQFQKDQLLQEIQKLKNNESELRNTIIGLTSEKDNLFNIMNNRSNSDLNHQKYADREAFENLCGQIAALQKENTCLHVENENIVSENKKLKMLNHSLTMHLNSDSNIAEERLNRVRLNNTRDAQIITDLHSTLQMNHSDYLDKISNLENEIMQLKRDLHSKSNDLELSQSQLKALQLQFTDLQSALDNVSEKYENAKMKNRNLVKTMESIESERYTNDNELSLLRQTNLRLKSKVKTMQNASYCSPLLNERMKILKVIAHDYNTISKIITRKEISLRDLALVAIFTLRWRKYAVRIDIKYCPSGGLNILAGTNFPSLSETISNLSSDIYFLKMQVHQGKIAQQSARDEMNKVLQRSREELAAKEAKSMQIRTLRKCNQMLNAHLTSLLPDKSTFH